MRHQRPTCGLALQCMLWRATITYLAPFSRAEATASLFMKWTVPMGSTEQDSKTQLKTGHAPSTAASSSSQLAGAAPGKSTLTERLPAGPAGDAETATSIAQSGVAGGGEPLPFRSNIMASFGRHDVSGARAHTDGAAGDAAGKLGARAYTVGNEIAFAGTPDLHTTAHEAAHYVQQRAGVALKGGIDQPGDEHERHADDVADAVVRGQSAEPLLDRIFGHGATAAPAPLVVQRKPTGSGTSADTKDALPSPVMLQVQGDRFKLTFRRGAERRLYCDVHYEGALPASAPFLKDNTVQMSADLEDPARAFNAKIVDVGTNSVSRCLWRWPDHREVH